MTEPSEVVVVDASLLVDLLLGGELGRAAAQRMDGSWLHAPGHLDAEVLSALGRLCRDGRLTPTSASARLRELRRAPVERHQVSELIDGAWTRRDSIRLLDALYVELADRLGTVVLTTDARLSRATPLAELVTVRQDPSPS